MTISHSPARSLEKELRELLYEERLILRLSRIALDAYSAGLVEQRTR